MRRTFGLAIALFLLQTGCAAQIVKSRAAAEFGCAESEVAVEQMAGGAYVASGCGRTATFVCVGGGQYQGQIACVHDDPPAQSASSSSGASTSSSSKDKAPSTGTGRSPEAVFPKSAAGMVFGGDVPTTAAACTNAGQTWVPTTKPDTYRCSGAPASVGFPAFVDAEFCDGALCKLDIVEAKEPEMGWVKRFLSVRELLEERYGEPSDVRSTLPDGCHNEMAKCLAEGRAAFWTRWRWKPGTGITLATGKASGELIMRVTYESARTKGGPAL